MKRYQPYLSILGLALFLRSIWAIAVPVMPLSDSHAYDVFAQNLASGNGYGWKAGDPTAYWPPGTSVLYSLFYQVFGHYYWPIVVFNIGLGIAIIALTMYLARLWFNDRVGILTGLILAIWPSQIQFTTVLASELIFNTLILIVLVLWFNEQINFQWKTILVGGTIAAASYVKTQALLLPFFLLFWSWKKQGKLLKQVSALLVMFTLIAVLIAPWTIRNTRVFGQMVAISTNGGTNLWMGNNPDSKGRYMKLPPEVKGMNEAQRNDYLKSLAVKHIQENPLLFIKRCFTRLIDTHKGESIGISWNQEGLTQRYGKWIILPLKLVNLIYWLAVLALALIGIVYLVKQYGWYTTIIHPTVVLWAYFAAIHMVIVAQDRYHFPSIPMIAILSAFTLSVWLNKKPLQRPISDETLS